MRKIAVIGSGFAGLAAATCLADAGMDVTIYEKNSSSGGRARKFASNGYVFDMGPSWYWMPDVFEKYFNRFGKSTKDFYSLSRLSPSYRVFYSRDDIMDVPASLEGLYQLFEDREPGSSVFLKKFLAEGKYKYEVGINKLVYKPGISIAELFDTELFAGLFKLDVFTSISNHVRGYFKNPELVQLLEFPVLFLGAPAQRTPALYSLMNYADMALGTWYPKGGMFKIAEAMEALARQQGVKFEFNAAVDKIDVASHRATQIKVNGNAIAVDGVVAGADYHHVEQHLLDKEYRQYSEKYWDSRVMAPSSLIFYLGIKKKVKNLLHHNLFFDRDFAIHAKEIYDTKKWPSDPLFYVCCTSKTDDTVAPEGHENMFILIPVAPDLKDDETVRENYFHLVMNRLEALTGDSIQAHIDYKRSYAHADFIADYNAFKGNAYGLANTILQTANLKPSILNKNVKNLFYTGQLTVPGPGVPPSLISGQVVAEELIKKAKSNNL